MNHLADFPPAEFAERVRLNDFIRDAGMRPARPGWAEIPRQWLMVT